MRTTVSIFDSGVGGLTVAGALHGLLPSLPLRYVADAAWFPDGERSAATVEERALTIARSLVNQGCSLLVVACNTASSAALAPLRDAFDVPIVGMEPPLKPAVERSRSGRVAVLVTPATARGERLARLHDDHAHGATVETVPMPGLAAMVEAGEVAGERVERLLRSGLSGPLRRGVDQVALGCTHYGFLRAAIDRLVGETVAVVDASAPVARRTLQQLEACALPLPGARDEEETVLCSTTGDPVAFEDALHRLRSAGAALSPLRVLPEAARLGAPR